MLTLFVWGGIDLIYTRQSVSSDAARWFVALMSEVGSCISASCEHLQCPEADGYAHR